LKENLRSTLSPENEVVFVNLIIATIKKRISTELFIDRISCGNTTEQNMFDVGISNPFSQTTSLKSICFASMILLMNNMINFGD